MPPKLRWSILTRDGFRCTYCGRTSAEGVRLVVDHIMPWADGGDDHPSNLTTACDDCNSGKSDTPLPDIAYVEEPAVFADRCPTRLFIAFAGVVMYGYNSYAYTWKAVSGAMRASGYTMPPRDRRDGRVWEAMRIGYTEWMADHHKDDKPE